MSPINAAVTWMWEMIKNKVTFDTASVGTTVVEHMPHHCKAEGLSQSMQLLPCGGGGEDGGKMKLFDMPVVVAQW